MADRHSGYVVTLADDIREDDAAKIITALGMVKGVVDVSPVVGDYRIAIAEARVKAELGEKLFQVLSR